MLLSLNLPPHPSEPTDFPPQASTRRTAADMPSDLPLTSNLFPPLAPASLDLCFTEDGVEAAWEHVARRGRGAVRWPRMVAHGPTCVVSGWKSTAGGVSCAPQSCRASRLGLVSKAGRGYAGGNYGGNEGTKIRIGSIRRTGTYYWYVLGSRCCAGRRCPVSCHRPLLL